MAIFKPVIIMDKYYVVLMTSNPLLRDIIVTNWYISRNIVASMKPITREKQIKSWNRKRKDDMIDAVNPFREELLPLEIATSLRSSQ